MEEVEEEAEVGGEKSVAPEGGELVSGEVAAEERERERGGRVVVVVVGEDMAWRV